MLVSWGHVVVDVVVVVLSSFSRQINEFSVSCLFSVVFLLLRGLDYFGLFFAPHKRLSGGGGVVNLLFSQHLFCVLFRCSLKMFDNVDTEKKGDLKSGAGSRNEMCSCRRGPSVCRLICILASISEAQIHNPSPSALISLSLDSSPNSNSKNLDFNGQSQNYQQRN